MDFWKNGGGGRRSRASDFSSINPPIQKSINPIKQMSKTSESANAKTKSAAKRAEVGPAMFGRDIFVEALEREGVEVIFAYPGGASMEIHQSLTHSKIRTILPRHEQGGSFAAEGYARATGKAGVCMA